MTLQGIYGNARQINRLNTNVERFQVLRYLCARKQDEIKPPTKGKTNCKVLISFLIGNVVIHLNCVYNITCLIFNLTYLPLFIL